MQPDNCDLFLSDFCIYYKSGSMVRLKTVYARQCCLCIYLWPFSWIFVEELWWNNNL